MADTPPRALQLDRADNVAVALAALERGERLELGGAAVTLVDPIRVGHKLALAPIERGAAIVKYHEPIGRASAAIAPGEHVHVHNVVSARLPGPDE